MFSTHTTVSSGGVRSVVTDGVGIGHPCCGIHDCKEPIVRSKGSRYCALHSDLEQQCAIIECTLPRDEGFRTCSAPAHRRLDDILRLENTAMFQLKNRLDRLNTLQSHKAIFSTVLTVTENQADEASRVVHPLDTTCEEPDSAVNYNQSMDSNTEFPVTIGAEDTNIRSDAVECDAKSSEGNKKIRALLGRRRTHNEEFAVASCGMILGRATFFGSEAVNGVLVSTSKYPMFNHTDYSVSCIILQEFWRGLFPTPEAVPEVMWHDQNCRLWSMLQNTYEETKLFFSHVALPVDVFHFKCKHKDSDIVCGTHCNPYIWDELRTENGTWRFNSSAAEQANVWAGKYSAIVREMEVERYNFFLDEMVKRRNRLTLKELEERGCRPYCIPREALLSQSSS